MSKGRKKWRQDNSQSNISGRNAAAGNSTSSAVTTNVPSTTSNVTTSSNTATKGSVTAVLTEPSNTVVPKIITLKSVTKRSFTTPPTSYFITTSNTTAAGNSSTTATTSSAIAATTTATSSTTATSITNSATKNNTTKTKISINLISRPHTSATTKSNIAAKNINCIGVTRNTSVKSIPTSSHRSPIDKTIMAHNQRTNLLPIGLIPGHLMPPTPAMVPPAAAAVPAAMVPPGYAAMPPAPAMVPPVHIGLPPAQAAMPPAKAAVPPAASSAPTKSTSGGVPVAEIMAKSSAHPKIPEKATADCITIDSNKAISIAMGTPYGLCKKYMNRGDCWHKITVNDGASYEDEHVMKLIMEAASPYNIIPVLYERTGGNSQFLARNCGSAIEKLCRSMLLINNPHGPDFTITVELNYAAANQIKINMQNSFGAALQERFDTLKKSLDLRGFHRHPQLVNLVFCPLNQPKILHYVLMMAKKELDANIIELNLANNDIDDIRSVELIPSLQHLDLRNNLIDDLSKLEMLKRCSITTLWLDGNPMCENYTSHEPYIKEVKLYAKSLKRLDGVTLGKTGFPVYQRNFLVDLRKHGVVDHFLGHYFNLYDSGSRLRMKGLYNSTALFSMTAAYLPGQTTSSTARMTQYMITSRNLLKLSDYSKAYSLVEHGEDNILALLNRLPATEHDPYSFTVDTAYVKDNVLSIYVCGIFREMSPTKEPLIRSFTRSFILVEVRPNEFQVVNEMLHVVNATTAQAKEAFRYKRPPIVVPSIARNASQNLTSVDKEQLIDILADVTEMNILWSKKCLEEAYWDIKDALISFTELYKRGRVPAEAFKK